MSLILLYHRIAAVDEDPFNLAVHPDRFAAHVEFLVGTGRVAPLGDALQPRGAGRIAMTFDDGYADNASVAAPMLDDAGLPATWFVTVDTLGRRRFWWDRLTWALLGPHPVPSAVDVEVDGRALWLDLRTHPARSVALRFLRDRLIDLPPDELEATVDRVLTLLDTPPAVQEDATMTVEQVRALDALPLQRVGAHSRSHARLGAQSAEVQHREVVGSVRALSDLLGRPVDDFAYPYGSSRRDVGPLAPRLVEESGCRLACTTDPPAVQRGNDPYRLPRLFIGDWPLDRFVASIDAFL